MDYQPGPFQPGPIRPIVQPGENVLLESMQGGLQLFRVKRYEPLFKSFSLIADINLVAGVPAALAAGAVGAQYDTTPLLNMSLGQMAQVRMRVLDDINVIIRQQGVPTNQTQTIQTQLNAFANLPENDPCSHLSEKFVWENYVLFLTPSNPQAYPAPRTRVTFWGLRYVMEGSSTEQGHLKPITTYNSLEDAMRARDPLFPNDPNKRLKFRVIPLGGFS